MVRGTMMCGTFVTAKHLGITAVFLVFLLAIGGIVLGVGVGMLCLGICGYEYKTCLSTRSDLIITGGILMALSVIGITYVGMLRSLLKEPPTPQQPVNPPYNNAMPGGPVVVAQQSQQLQSLSN